MSSDSPLGPALLTGASADFGRSLALRLAKNFDVVIDDLSEASKPLVKFKAQFKNQRRAPIITLLGPMVKPIRDILTPAVGEVSGTLSLSNKQAVVEYLKSSRFPSKMTIGVFSKIESGDRSALTLVIVDEEGSVPGAMGPSKSVIRGLTEAAATELGPYGINVNSYLCQLGAFKTDKGACGQYKGTFALNGKVAIKLLSLTSLNRSAQVAVGHVETAEDAADLISFLTSKSARSITGTVHSLTFL
ncbi:hypothetical protein C0992_011251 [Termitomyces sp. T32_za158]|nr:hypothetical protein C0992_011251 [Termitomyces sp. T32_za158]